MLSPTFQFTVDMLILQVVTTNVTYISEICSRIQSSTGGAIVVNQAALLPTLSRMTEKGWILLEVGIVPAYRLTDQGRQLVQNFSRNLGVSVHR